MAAGAGRSPGIRGPAHFAHDAGRSTDLPRQPMCARCGAGGGQTGPPWSRRRLFRPRRRSCAR
jgi:hypothetical protein